MKVKEICDYSGSTLLGMNGGMMRVTFQKELYMHAKLTCQSLKRKNG